MSQSFPLSDCFLRSADEAMGGEDCLAPQIETDEMCFDADETAENGVFAAIDAFCDALRFERNASVETIRAYRNDLEDCAGWFLQHGLDLLHADYRQLRSYLGHLNAEGKAKSTINRHLSSLHGFYRWANVAGITDVNPASALKSMKQPQTLPHVIQPTDMARLLSVYREDVENAPASDSDLSRAVALRNQALMEFLYACGARISEASNLLLCNVFFGEKTVKLFGKGSKERVVPVHDLAIESMMLYVRTARGELLQGKPSPYFFVSTRGNQWNTDGMRKVFKEAVLRAQLDETLSPHAMRHTFATDVLNGGANLRTVQEMLGHVSLSTTQIYTHVSINRLKDVHLQAHPRA